MLEQKTVRVHEGVGGYYLTPEEVDYLDERGASFVSKAQACRRAHFEGYTHVVLNGKKQRIPARYRVGYGW